MIHATTTTKLDRDNPWPGLDFYKEDAQYFFFGREPKVEELLNKVLDAPVTVLFGRSGLGKTSLLQAGLFPLLREHDFLPIYVRFEIGPKAAQLTRQLHDAVRDSIQQADLSDAMLPSDEETLWEYLHRNDFELWSARNYQLTPVIVLDQFEELFTLGEKYPDRVDTFRNDLGDLAESRIPADLTARIKSAEVVAGQFNLRSRNYKLLISLREDYLPHLDDWRRLIPALGRSRMRLLPLQESEALDAVRKPAADLMTDALAHRVVDAIAGAGIHPGRRTEPSGVDRPNGERKVSDVDPALLSLFCRELNEVRKRNGQARFDEQLVEDNKDTTIANYYSSCVRDLEPSVAEFIEKELISENGFRNFYPLEDAVPFRLTDRDLAHLIDSRLLRVVDHYGAQRIELTHDVLTRTVRDHRDRRRVEEEKKREKAALAEAAKRERQVLAHAAELREAELDRERLAEREWRLESEKTAARRLKRLLAVVAIACIVAIISAGWALKERQDAQTRSQEALAQRLAADSQLMLAELSPLGSHDVKLMHMLLAAHAIPSTQQAENYELLTTLNKERDVLTIIDLPTATKGVAFSPDGALIASGSDDKAVRLWNTDGQLVTQPMHHDGKVTSVAFSPDGALIATGSDDKAVRLWNTDGQLVTQPMHHDDKVTSVAFSPDSALIATGSGDNAVRLWTADGKLVSQPMRHDKARDDAVTSVAFSPDGSRIASASTDSTIRMWDPHTQKQIAQTLGHAGAVTSVAFSPDSARIATGGDDRIIRLWDAETGRLVGLLFGHEAAVTALAYAPDNRNLVSSGGDGTVRLWDSNWQPLFGHEDAAWAGFFDDGQKIGSGSWDKTVRWWDPTTGRPIGEPVQVNDADVEALFPVDEDRLLSLGSVNTARLWDARTGEPIGEPLRLPQEPDYIVTDRTVSRIAAQLEPGVVQVYKTDTMRPVEKPILPVEEVWTIDFSGDGRILATGGVSGTVELWDSDTGARIGQPMKDDGGPVSSIAFSSDGNLLAVGHEDYTLRLWDTGTSQRVGERMALEDAFATAAAFSPDGRTVASGGDDGTIRLWDVVDQTPLGSPVPVHRESVTSLEFSQDGTELLSASADQTLRVWPVVQPDPGLLCAKLTHNVTRDQWNEMVSPEIEYKTVCPNLSESEYAGKPAP